MKNILLTATFSITIVALLMGSIAIQPVFAGLSCAEQCQADFVICQTEAPLLECIEVLDLCRFMCENQLPPPEPQVAGQLLPLDSTALLLAGIQSMTVWMVPTILGLAGVGVYLVKYRANRD